MTLYSPQAQDLGLQGSGETGGSEMSSTSSGSQGSLTSDSRREMRRRKILDNAKSRMDKLKNTQRSEELAKEYQCTEDLPSGNNIPLKSDSNGEVAPDPPDEVIPKLGPAPETPYPPNQPNSTFTSAVNRFVGGGIWKLRTLLAALCALTVVVMEGTLGLVYSSVILMFLLDCTLLVYILLTPHASNTAANPLGNFSLVKLPLSFLSPSVARWFDPVFLCLLLAGHLLRDIFIMIFLTIVCKMCITLVT